MVFGLISFLTRFRLFIREKGAILYGKSSFYFCILEEFNSHACEYQAVRPPKRVGHGDDQSGHVSIRPLVELNKFIFPD